MININNTELEIIKSIIIKNIAHKQVWAFGSRVNGNVEKYSDLDIVVVDSTALTLQELGNLKNDFQNSDLTFCIDIIDWNTIDEDFKNIVKNKYEILHKPD